MTKPSITYGHHKLNDCYTATGYTKTDNGNTSTFTIADGDIFKIVVTNCAGAEETKVVNDVNIVGDTTLFTEIHWRYRTSSSSIKAKIIVTDDAAYTQTVLADESSTVWKYGKATLTPGENLDHVQLYADHATGTVYYDFWLICEGTFPFPFVSDLEELELVNNYANGKMPGRVGDITQYMGMDSPLIRLRGKMDMGAGWEAGTDSIPGFRLTDIALDSRKEPWQWLASDLINCKVVMPRLKISKVARSKSLRLWTVTLKHFSLSSGDADNWGWQSWLGLK